MKDGIICPYCDEPQCEGSACEFYPGNSGPCYQEEQDLDADRYS